MTYIIPTICCVVALILGLAAVRRRAVWVVLVVLALLFLIVAWAFWQIRETQGWEVIGYAFIAVLMAAPAIFGLLFGALIGWVRNRKDAREG